MIQAENPLVVAEHDVQQFESLVARQAARVVELEQGGHAHEINRAREVLATLERDLWLAQTYLATLSKPRAANQNGSIES